MRPPLSQLTSSRYPQLSKSSPLGPTIPEIELRFQGNPPQIPSHSVFGRRHQAYQKSRSSPVCRPDTNSDSASTTRFQSQSPRGPSSVVFETRYQEPRSGTVSRTRVYSILTSDTEASIQSRVPVKKYGAATGRPSVPLPVRHPQGQVLNRAAQQSRAISTELHEPAVAVFKGVNRPAPEPHLVSNWPRTPPTGIGRPAHLAQSAPTRHHQSQALVSAIKRPQTQTRYSLNKQPPSRDLASTEANRPSQTQPSSIRLPHFRGLASQRNIVSSQSPPSRLRITSRHPEPRASGQEQYQSKLPLYCPSAGLHKPPSHHQHHNQVREVPIVETYHHIPELRSYNFQNNNQTQDYLSIPPLTLIPAFSLESSNQTYSHYPELSLSQNQLGVQISACITVTPPSPPSSPAANHLLFKPFRRPPTNRRLKNHRRVFVNTNPFSVVAGSLNMADRLQVRPAEVIKIKAQSVEDARLMQAKVLDECKKTGKEPPPYGLEDLIGKGSFGRVYKG